MDKKTLLKIWLNPALNLTTFRGTGPWRRNKTSWRLLEFRRLLDYTVCCWLLWTSQSARDKQSWLSQLPTFPESTLSFKAFLKPPLGIWNFTINHQSDYLIVRQMINETIIHIPRWIISVLSYKHRWAFARKLDLHEWK